MQNYNLKIKNRKNKIVIFVIAILFFIAIKPNFAFADTVGDVVNFHVEQGYDYTGRTTVNAENLVVGDHCYIYVEQEYLNSLSAVEKNNLNIRVAEIAQEFDTNIQPRMRIVYGAEWIPGIDNDEKITLLFFKLVPDAGGYFTSIDETLKNNVPESNQREMIYLNVRVIGSERVKAFIAHEFQHLITFFQKFKLKNLVDDAWLEEARSEYAPTLLDYDDIYNKSNLEERVEDFINQPFDPLCEWGNSIYDYGSVTLFMQYLVDHYGINIINSIINNSKVGIQSVDMALNNIGSSDTFADVFTNWSITNFLNDQSILDGKYSYKNTNLGYAHMHIYPTASFAVSFYTNAIINTYAEDWSPRWYKFNYQNIVADSNVDTLSLEFSSGDTKLSNFQVPYIIYYANGEKEVKYIDIDKTTQKGTVLITGFGKTIISVVAIPSNQFKTNSFTFNDNVVPFTIKASMKNIPSYTRGSLIRAQNGTKVYIINNEYKRWIQSGEIFNFYGHLNWAAVQNVSEEDLTFYNDAWLVRADGDYKVYEINGDGTKHWLNITAEQFEASGRKWEMVSIINKAERDFYITGADVMK